MSNDKAIIFIRERMGISSATAGSVFFFFCLPLDIIVTSHSFEVFAASSKFSLNL